MLGVLLFAGCGGGLSSSPSPLAAANEPSLAVRGASDISPRGSHATSNWLGSPLSESKLTILHSFAGPDGWRPFVPLLNVDGVLYGTTFEGGYSRNCGPHEAGCSVVFKYSGTGLSKVSFLAKSVGENPRAGLINLDGRLFGVAGDGGAFRRGSLFAITHSGASVVHSFKDADGDYPLGGLVDVDGTLYGTTGTAARTAPERSSRSPSMARASRSSA